MDITTLYKCNGLSIILSQPTPTNVSSNNDFADNMELDYKYDEATKTNYTVLRIYQTKRDGSKQFPFVRCTGERHSALTLSQREDWDVICNCGLGVSDSQPIDGVLIQNSEIVYGIPATHHEGSMPLTIDKNGNLGYAEATATGEELLAKGYVSVVCGFCPIIVDYKPTESFPTVKNVNHFHQAAQRQIIGQWGNGDYCILSCEGRNFDNSTGWSLPNAQVICQKLGLKFAYNFDGGGSVQTMIGKKHVNSIYRDGTGRLLPSFIVFNGTDKYFVPHKN